VNELINGGFSAGVRLIPLRLCWRGGMQTIEMDNSKLIAFLGHEPQTPLTEAVRSTLAAWAVFNITCTFRKG
jgi:nucleoside-diphosphate-sugar epimerase